MSFDLVIFDCDGTLVDSEYLNNLATIEILHEEGLTQYDLDYAFAHFVGQRLKIILENITNETGHIFPANLAARYIARVDALTPQYLKPIPGANELVQAAVKAGKKICVASNGQRENVLHSLTATGLKSFFPDKDIFTASDVKNGKPAPDIFLLAATKLGSAPPRAVVIEDSVPGVTGAAAAGIKTYGFVSHHQDAELYAERLLQAGAHSVFTSLTHIKHALFS